MVKLDNNERQQEMDETGFIIHRNLNVSTALLITEASVLNVSLISCITQFNSLGFTNPKYELVAMHPEHFLPYANVLPIFHSATSTPTLYVSARDRHIRESPEPDSPHLPAFHHACESCRKFEHLNVFLVVLNAEIKFH